MGGAPIHAAGVFWETGPMPHPRPAPGQPLKLLLVEDSRYMQEVLTEALRSLPRLDLAGVAETATDACAAFELHRPDVVVLDLVLRGSSGLDVLHEIKQRAPACRVVVFTGYDSEPYRTRCLAAGADHFFSKNRQHRDLLQHLHDCGAEPATGAGPADAADFSQL